MKKIIFIGIASISILGCHNRRAHCKREIEMYYEKWEEKVKRVYKDPDHRATYIIETFSDRRIIISPVQFIIADASPGDSIYKESFSKKAILITKERDTFYRSLYSSSCDDQVWEDRMKRYGH